MTLCAPMCLASWQMRVAMERGLNEQRKGRVLIADRSEDNGDVDVVGLLMGTGSSARMGVAIVSKTPKTRRQSFTRAS